MADGDRFAAVGSAPDALKVKTELLVEGAEVISL